MKYIEFDNVYKGYNGKIPKNKDRTADKDFKDINIIFGTNGSGKTTLTKYLEKNYKAVVFNRNYIENNILLEDEVSLKGIKLISGNDSIEISKQIKVSEENLKNKNKEREELLTEYEKIDKELNKTIEKINADNKAGTRIHIKDLDSAENIIKNNEKRDGTLKIDYKKYNIENLTLFEEKDRFRKYRILDLEISDEMLKTLSISYSEKNYNYADYNWMLKGMKLLDNNECPFCSQVIDNSKILDINNYIKDETNKAKYILNNLYKVIEKVNRSEFQNPNKDNKFLSEKIEEKLLKIEDDEIFDILERLKKFILDKLNNMNLVSEEYGDVKNNILSINEDIKQNNKILEDEEKKLLKEASKKSDIIKLNIAELVINNDLIISKHKELNDVTVKGKNTKIEIENLNKQIKELKEQIASIRKFVVFFNSKITQMGYHFYLDIDNETYILKSKIIDEIKLEQLSEGERFIFAFIYFYYENMLEYEQNKKLLVVDDPFTSLDSDNKYYIEGLLIEFIKNNEFNANMDEQLFILTHHYSFFVDLIESMHSKDKSLALILENIDGNKTLCVTDSKVKEYKLCYKKIIEFNNNPNEEKSIGVGNIIRRCVETFCRFNFDINGVSDVNLYHEKLFKGYKDISEVRGFLKFVNSYSHSINDMYSYNNIKQYAKVFEELFENQFPGHHNSMKD